MILLYINDLVLLICCCSLYQLARHCSVVKLHYIILAWHFEFINTVQSFRFLCYNYIVFKWFLYLYYIYLLAVQTSGKHQLLMCLKKIIIYFYTFENVLCFSHLSSFSLSGYNLNFFEHLFSFFELFFYCLQTRVLKYSVHYHFH